MKQLILPLALAVLTVLAGCGTVPTDEGPSTPDRDRTFSVQMTGNSSATYMVSAHLVADPFENVTVTYANGTNRNVSMPQRNEAITFGPDSGATAVEPRGNVVGGVNFEGAPAFTVTDNEVPPTGNAVVSVRQQGESVLSAWGVIRCDGHVSGISMVANESGITGFGFSCES